MAPTPAIRVAAAALLLSSCSPPTPPSAIDPVLAARVPTAAIAIAGIDLNQLRASPLYAKLPAPAAAFLEPFSNAQAVLIASTGAEFLAIARGTVQGATQLPPGLALLGSPAVVAAATAPHAPPAILAAAETVAAGHPIWIALRGGAALPVSGNLANVNNLVTLADYLTISVQLHEALDLELIAPCPTSSAALQFEQRLRALISVLTAAAHRPPTLTGLQIRRDDRTIRATLSVPPAVLSALLP